MPYKDPIIRKIKARERGLRWVIKNPDKVKAKSVRYRLKNHEKVLERCREWYALHKAEAHEATRRWRNANPEMVRAQRRAWKHKKYYSDINYKLIETVRSRIRLALQKNQKKGGTLELLGCTIKELKNHLEKLFLPGMTWENWTNFGWHIDHIIPLDAFDLSDEKQLKKACNYTNLSPLWWDDNLKKSNKYEREK